MQISIRLRYATTTPDKKAIRRRCRAMARQELWYRWAMLFLLYFGRGFFVDFRTEVTYFTIANVTLGLNTALQRQIKPTKAQPSNTVMAVL